MAVLYYILLGILFLIIMWAGARIIQKAGFQPMLVLLLLIPVINIIAIWAFAFSEWPNKKSDNKLIV